MRREELLKSPAYWTAGLQIELYRQIVAYMEHHGLNKTQLAEHLGCTKGYVTQLLNGDFDHKLSKFVELSLAVNKIPEITFSDVDEYIVSEQNAYIASQLSENDEAYVSYNSESEPSEYLLAA